MVSGWLYRLCLTGGEGGSASARQTDMAELYSLYYSRKEKSKVEEQVRGQGKVPADKDLDPQTTPEAVLFDSVKAVTFKHRRSVRVRVFVRGRSTRPRQIEQPICNLDIGFVVSLGHTRSRSRARNVRPQVIYGARKLEVNDKVATAVYP